jgi:hypothetical protein
MIHYLQLIMRLTGYPGYFGADQEVGEITLNFWYVLQETIADLGLLPLDKRPNHDLEYDANSQETISAAYKQLVFVLRDKAMIPPDHEYNSWSKGNYHLLNINITCATYSKIEQTCGISFASTDEILLILLIVHILSLAQRCLYCC